jgi:uncharacterized membrane protein SpoIIM required for sporulation
MAARSSDIWLGCAGAYEERVNDQSHFFQKAKPVWDELSALCDRLQRGGPRGLTADELSRLDRLYRLSTVHLSQIRHRTTDERLTRDLNRLVARAHSLIYVAPSRNLLLRIGRFYAIGFAETVARMWRFHLASFLLFIVSAFLGFHLANRDPFVAYALTWSGDNRLPGSSTEQLESALRHGRDVSEGEKLMFASQLFTHNTKVGFLAFASGVLACVPTILLMVMNGAQIGGFAATHYRANVQSELWAWLLPHGVTEISAIILCGGAGLMMGYSILRPGYKTRKQSLADAARVAVKMAMGVVPMFFLAGWIESFVRQSQWTTSERFEFAALTLVFWLLYFAAGNLSSRLLDRKQKVSSAIPNL